MAIPGPGATLFRKFTTRAFATGVPTTLSGSPVVSIYKDGSTTQSVSGVSLTVDFDSVTGLNHVAIDTSSDGTFYSAGSQFFLVITTGTVGGTSVVGEAVGEFYLDSSVASQVWQDTTSGDFTVSGSIGKSLFTSGNAPGTSSGLFITSSYTAAPTTAAIRTAVFTDLLSSSDFATAGSIGKALKNLSSGVGDIIYSSVIPSQSGITTSQVKLDTGASSVDGAYVGDVFSTTMGDTGQGSLICISYVGSTRVATLQKAWVVAPIAGDTIEVTATAYTFVAGYLTGQDPATLVLGATAASWNTTGTIGHDINLIGTTGGIEVNVTQWHGEAVPLPNISGVPIVDMSYIDGTSSVGSPGYIGIDWGYIDHPTTTQNLSGTTINSSGGGVDVNVVSWDGDPVVTPNVPGVPIVDIGFVLGQSASLYQGAVQAATSNSVTLANSEPSVDDYYKGAIITIEEGTGAKQWRYIPSYVGASRIATVHRPWEVIPDTSSKYIISGLAEGDAYDIEQPALARFFTTDSGQTHASAVDGSVVKEASTGGGGGGDPWLTALPGAYMAGTAGYILGTYLDIQVSSRSTYGGTDTPGTVTLLSRIGGPITINGGAVAIDWGNVANPTSTVNLSNTTISNSQVVASVTGNVTVGGLTAAALAQFFTVDTGEVYADAVPGSVVKEIATNASGGGTSDLTAAEVWAYATRTLTALPPIPNNWITAAGITDHALDGKGDWSTYAGGDTSGVTTLLTRISGNITIVAGGVNINLAQTLGAARLLNAVGDTSLTLNDVGHSAIAAAAGQESVVGLVYTIKTPFTATIIRTFSLDSGTAPKVRS